MKKKQGTQPELFSETTTPKAAFHNIRNYLAGQFVGATRDDTLLEEVIKCLFSKIQLEHENATLPADSTELAKLVREGFARVRQEFPEIFPDSSEILLAPAALAYIFNQLAFPLADAISDPVGDAFEVFVGSQSKGNSGQFFTPRAVTDLLAEALAPKLNETVLDPACGAGGFLRSVCAYHLKGGVLPRDIASWVGARCYGIDKDAHLVHLARSHLSLLTRAHPTLLCGDSIAMRNNTHSLREGLPPEGIDVILTNPPFGVKIVAALEDVLKNFELANRAGKALARNIPPQVLFVERCFTLLKPGGRLGMVLPESLLSNKSYRSTVDFILREGEIRAVIGMPESLFKTSGKGGTHTKTCLLIAQKRTSKKRTSDGRIFMAEAKWCGHDSRARSIPHNDLPTIAARYQSHISGNLGPESTLGFSTGASDIKEGVLCPRYYDPQGNAELEALRGTHSLLCFGDLVKSGALEITTGDEIGKLAYGTGSIPFVRTSDISNWEIKADAKHGVSSDIYDSLKKAQDIKEGDLLMVKDGTYLIGTCAYVSAADIRMIYQSHIYKIRVNPNAFGLNAALLLAVLSSKSVQRQIRSKQFTQDIIDSLGTRVHELVLPIPRDKTIRNEITAKVVAAVENRVRARELARAAKELVGAGPDID